VLLFLGLNLWLATSWGTGFFERKIEARLGLPCTIGAISWSPWAGVQVRNLRLMPPRDTGENLEILKIESVNVDLSWRSLAKGQKRFQRLEIHGVTGEVSLELLQSLAARGQATERPGSADPVEVPTAPVMADNTESPSGPSPEVPPKPSPVDQGAPEPAESDLKVVPVDDFEGGVAFERVNLRLYSRRFPGVSVGVADVSGEIPIWGGDREGLLTIGDLELGKRFHSQRIEVPVILKDRFLKVDDYQVKLFGLDLSFTAALWMVQGLPYGVQLNLPSQQMDLTPIYLDGEPPFTIGTLQSSGQMQGHLLDPGASVGGSYTTFENLEMIDGKDGSRTRFQSGSAHLQLSAAGLIARDFRIMGEEEAVLGNGFATPGGDAAAVVRIVASPNRAESHEKRVGSASDELALKFEPLVTPDREFRDLHLELRSGNLMIDLGQGGQWVPFFPAARAVAGSPDSNLSLYP